MRTLRDGLTGVDVSDPYKGTGASANSPTVTRRDGEVGKTLLPDDFCITPQMRTWAAREIPSVDIEREHGRFCDYWWGNGKKMLKWDAVWRNWMRRAPQMGGAMKPREFSIPKAPSGAPIQIRDHPLFKGIK